MTSNSSNDRNDNNYLQARCPTPAIDPVQCGVWPGCSYSNNHHVGEGMRAWVNVNILPNVPAGWCIMISFFGQNSAK